MDSCTDNNFANTNVSNTNGTSRIKILCNFGWSDKKAVGWYLKSLSNILTENGNTHNFGERLRMIKYEYTQH